LRPLLDEHARLLLLPTNPVANFAPRPPPIWSDSAFADYSEWWAVEAVGPPPVGQLNPHEGSLTILRMPGAKLRPRKIGFAEATSELRVAVASAPKTKAVKILRMLCDMVVAPLPPAARYNWNDGAGAQGKKCGGCFPNPYEGYGLEKSERAGAVLAVGRAPNPPSANFTGAPAVLRL
jgi:hypothetical protein